jgi:hypothetical protein
MQKPESNSSNSMEEKELAIICKEITKVYSKASSSIQERKRTWQLLLETLLKGKKKYKTQRNLFSHFRCFAKNKEGGCRWNYRIKWIWKKYSFTNYCWYIATKLRGNSLKR